MAAVCASRQLNLTFIHETGHEATGFVDITKAKLRQQTTDAQSLPRMKPSKITDLFGY